MLWGRSSQPVMLWPCADPFLQSPFGEGSITPHSHCLTYTSMNVLVKETARMIEMVFPTQQPNACRLARTPSTTSHSETGRVGKEHLLFTENVSGPGGV